MSRSCLRKFSLKLLISFLPRCLGAHVFAPTRLRLTHELIAFEFLILLMVDRAIAIGYTPISATGRRHFPTIRDGLDSNSL
jgi:hypothetical protein